jgi:multidrug efflux pump subunit AcrA (membrane-fusion protein)
VAADQKALAETTLAAPISGAVTAVNGSVGGAVSGSGSTVSKGAASSASSTAATGGAAGGGAGSGSSSSSSSAFATIDSLGQLEIVSGFAEADATKIAVGQPATITFPALPSTEVAGKVVAVSSTSTVVSNVVTYDETVALINPPPGVKDGMTAQVSVVDQTANNALELPSSAITTTGAISTVELLQNGKTTLTTVKTGLVGNSSTQIVSGLKAGDIVVEPTVTITAASSSSSTSTGLGSLTGGGGGGGGFGGGAGFGGGGGGITRGG